MKLVLSALLLFIGTVQGFSQIGEINEDWETNRHHELGVDATAFIKQFLSLNGEFYGYEYAPIYQFTYRYKTSVGNIRFGAGGNYLESEFQNLYIQDSTIRKRMNNSINIRIGWEFKTDLSKRWQAFYGVDFRPSFYYTRNDAYDYNYQYIVGQESKNKVMGVAPLLGFRFKLTPRLSLTTEASFAVNFAKSTNRTYYMPRYDFVPLKDEVKSGELNSIYGTFNAPLSVIVTFDL